jgi:hypothetical protein
VLLLTLCAGAVTPARAESLVESYSPADMLSVDDPAYKTGDWLLGKAAPTST